MIELALLLGLGAVGYMLAVNDTKTENFTGVHHSPRPTELMRDDVVHSQEQKGHNNEVPFFGGHVTQEACTLAPRTVFWTHMLEPVKEYFQKREVKSFFDAKPGTGNPFGNQDESEFFQSRMVSGQNMKNVFPVEQVHVGPGANDGYTNIPQGWIPAG